MADLPYVLLSCSMSIDGYVARASGPRLLLSNEADFDRVDAERAASDAILVGAETVRKDNPRLLVRSERRRRDRTSTGRPADPVKVTLTRSGDLDPGAAFFSTGHAEKLVYCPSRTAGAVQGRLGHLATVVDSGERVEMRALAEDLQDRGVRRLMVEGGGSLHTQLLTEGLADELQLVVAPFFVGDAGAPRFVGDGRFPWCPERRATLAETRTIGDVVLLRYALSERFGEC